MRRIDVVPALLYALPETGGLTDQQLQPPRQPVQCRPAPCHHHEQKAGWHPSPDSSCVCGSGGSPAHAHPQQCEAQAPLTRGQDA
eukprot:39607-Chlamydomonas_euryale.AAC.6